MEFDGARKALTMGPDAFLLIGLATLPDMDYNVYSDLHTLGGYLRQSTPTLAAMQRCAKALLQTLLPDIIPMAHRDAWLSVIGTKSLSGRYRIAKRTLVATAVSTAFNKNAIRRSPAGCTVAEIEVSFSKDSLQTLAHRWQLNGLGYLLCLLIAVFTHQRLAWLTSSACGILAALCAHFCRDLGQFRPADAGDIKNLPDMVLGVSRSDRILTKITMASLPRVDVHRADFLRTPQTYGVRDGPIYTAAKLFGACCVIGHATTAMNGDIWCRWGLALLHLLSVTIERYRPPVARVGTGCASAKMTRCCHHQATLSACVAVASDIEQLKEVLAIMFDPSQRREDETDWLIYLWKGLQQGIQKRSLEQTYAVHKPMPQGWKIRNASDLVEQKLYDFRRQSNAGVQVLAV